MKKILIFTVLLVMIVTVKAQISSQKKLIDHPEYIEILDSSRVDSEHAPLLISKRHIVTVRKSPSGREVQIVLNNENAGQIIPDVKLGAKEFNDFATDSALLAYLKAIYPPDFSGYIMRISYTGDNADTIHYEETATNDTSFYQWINYSGSNPTNVGWEQY